VIYDTIKAAVRVHGLLVIANVSIQPLSLDHSIAMRNEFRHFFNNEFSSIFLQRMIIFGQVFCKSINKIAINERLYFHVFPPSHSRLKTKTQRFLSKNYRTSNYAVKRRMCFNK